MQTEQRSWFRRPTHPLYALLVLGLLAMAGWAFWPRAVRVETATVHRGAMSIGFTEEGRTRLHDRFLVSAPVDGVIDRVQLEPGDSVRAGQTVAALRPASSALLDPATRADAEMRWRTAGDERNAALANLAAASAANERAISALKRLETLVARQQVSLEVRDDARRQAAVAAAQLRSAQAQLQAATTRRDAARTWLDLSGSANRQHAPLLIPAPVDGLVIRRLVQSEGLVRAGQPLLEVGDPGELEVVVEVLTADALRLRPGMPVRLQFEDGAKAIEGRVHTIEPGGFTKVSALGVEEQRVLVVVSLPPVKSGLGDAYRVDARFQVWSAPSVLLVPVAALFRDGAHWAVYLARDGRARLQRIEIGHVGENDAEVVSGLVEGDRVVTYPGDVVRDGLRIAVAPST